MDNPPVDKDAIQAPQCECTYCWPLEYMKKEEFKKGDVLFKAGDTADKMYYVKKGAIKLLEINKIVGEGQVIGEMGIFSPFKTRTASAVCHEDLEAYTMGRDEVIKFFAKDPNVAIDLIQLSIKRFIENLKKETEARERIASELRIAHDIQNSMLPQVFPPFPDRKEFDIFATMYPAKEVGGDFYDFFFVNDDKLCVIIGDVSGKGVPAALFMAICKTLFKTVALQGASAGEIVARVNNTLSADNPMCMFVTVFCLLLDTRTGEVEFCSGGHNPPLVCSIERGCTEYISAPTGMVVGAMENSQCQASKLTLKPGEFIFLYTDGVSEAMNSKRQLFSEVRLNDCLNNHKNKAVTDMISSLRADIVSYVQDAPQSDDITMVALRYKGVVS
ncbi:MAG: SpoIIE family protein phosphatase [Candidatus Omnitrophota bacterium]